MVSTSRATKQGAYIALGVAIIIYVAVNLFGLLMPVIWGHYGFHYGEYVLRARVALRFHTLIPAHWAGVTFPPLETVYLHHPILASVFLAGVFILVGEHHFLVRAVPATWGLFTLFLLFRIARRHFGDFAAATAVLVYATCPFTAAFSAHYDPGNLAAPGFLLAADSWLAYREHPKRSLAFLAILGWAICGSSEWTPYCYAVFFLPIAFLMQFWDRRRKPWSLRFDSAQWLAIAMGATLVLTLGLHFLFTWRVGALPDLLASYRNRSQAIPLAVTISRQSLFLNQYFGKPLLIVASLWAVSVIGRFICRQSRAADLIPFSMLFGWLFYVKLFPIAVYIHSYRTMPLVGFMALASASIASAIPLFIRKLTERFTPVAMLSGLSSRLLLVGGLVAILAQQIPHARHALLAAREKAGTEEFHPYDPHIQQFFFAQSIRDRIPRDALVLTHRNIGARTEFIVLVDRELREISHLGEVNRLGRGRRVFVVWDRDKLPANESQAESRLVTGHGVFMIEQFAVVDMSATNQRIETRRIKYDEPNAFYRYFVSHKYRPMSAIEGIRPIETAWFERLGLKKQ
jgi:hypothetical protein